MSGHVFVCQWYPPEPAEVPRSIAMSLAALGPIEVLTGVPNYPTGVVAAGHRAWELRVEQSDGLRVLRTPLYPSHDSSALKRMANYLSWAVSSSLLGQRRLRRAEAVLVYSSPATAALPAMVARTLWGTPYVLLVQDVWPDSIFASGFLPGRAGRLVRGAMSAFVNRTYALADHVAVISPGMADLLESRGVPRDKLSVVYNWVPEEDDPSPAGTDTVAPLRERVGLDADDVAFLYAGNHGHAQNLDAVVEAFLEHTPANAHLVLLGQGVAKQTLRDRARGASTVHFLDPVPRAEAQVLLHQADVSVVSLADEPLFAVTMPSKVQSGLATARPLLVVVRGDAAKVVEEAGAGLAATPGDPLSIGAAVETLTKMSAEERRQRGEAGREVYRAQMSRAIGARRLHDLLTQAASRRRRRKDR